MAQRRSLAVVATCLVVVMILESSNVHSLPAVDRDPENVSYHKLLCLMIDGFRWDYVDQQPGKLPGFERFLTEGVRANWSNPSFPTLTYPMWTTLGTGLYPETHGLVGNHLYDPKDKDVFSIDDVPSMGKKKWWTAEPIWVTATRAGIDIGSIFSSYCNVLWDGITPRHCEPYDHNESPEMFRKNLEKALDLLEHDYGYVMVYTVRVDIAGHVSGPETGQLLQEVRSVDSDIGFLLDQLDERGLTNQTNIIILSDHGMTDTAPDRVVSYDIDDYLDTSLVEKIGDRGPLMNIKVPPENVEKVFDQLSAIPEGVDVYRHDDIPDRYHFRNSEYAHEILVVARKGYFLNPTRDQSKQIPPVSGIVFYGSHGYDPDEMDMKGIFFAKGPDFVKDAVIPPIDMVDVYQLICHLLDLKPLPNNGTWAHVSSALVLEDPEGAAVAGTCPRARTSSLVILFGLLLIMTQL